jgi:nucleotide-binding universal stress UspA family protein
MKIVVAIDGSPVAKRALLEALELGTELREPPEIHAVTVIDHITPPGGLGKAPPGVPDLLAPEAETALVVASEIAAEKGAAIRTQILRGHAAAEILEYAGSLGADLIVIGACGHGGFRGPVLGRVCDQVVRESTIPVLTVNDPALG